MSFAWIVIHSTTCELGIPSRVAMPPNIRQLIFVQNHKTPRFRNNFLKNYLISWLSQPLRQYFYSPHFRHEIDSEKLTYCRRITNLVNDKANNESKLCDSKLLPFPAYHNVSLSVLHHLKQTILHRPIKKQQRISVFSQMPTDALQQNESPVYFK